MSEARPRQKVIWYVVGCVGLVLASVPCLGIASAIAIPSFVNYARRAKTTEARSTVGVLRNGLLASCTETGALPDALGPTLAAPGPERQVATLDPRWSEYGLVGEPSYYAYAIERPDAATAIIVATGDLDGDGARARFSATCTTDGSGRACSCGELTVTDELE